MTQEKHVVIIGGGISGLSAAYYLQKEAQANNLNVSYTLLEQSDRWGGKILTDRATAVTSESESFIIEGGPDSFISQKPWALQLARELGLADELLPTNDHKRKTFVLNNGRPTPFPDGVLLIVPTKIMPFAKSRLISPLGKLRMGLDLFIPAKRDGADETLADFIKRRLGSEALDKIAEPLLSGIYNADAEMQSIMATFPRFRSLEEKHGSLIRGMLASRQSRQKSAAPSANGNKKPMSMFTSFENGMQTLVDAVRAELTGDCRLGTAVTKIETRDWRLEAGQQSATYLLSLSDGSKLAAKTIIFAIPAFAAAKLLTKEAPEAAEKLAGIRYVSTGTISLAYRREDIAHPLDGFGIVIPRSENRQINAITWTSTKFDMRAPEDYVLLRGFFGGSRTPEMMDVADDALLTVVKQELQAIMDIDTEPLFHRIYRWSRSNPQYDVGHLERVAAIEAALPEGLYVTGSPYRGVGVPDCVHQAQLTAVTVIKEQLNHLTNQSETAKVFTNA